MYRCNSAPIDQLEDRGPSKPEAVGSIPTGSVTVLYFVVLYYCDEEAILPISDIASVVQSVEYRSYKARVVGSSPTGSKLNYHISRYDNSSFLFFYTINYRLKGKLIF